ncbi:MULTISPECIES: shikimate dehydrogenase [unclassified Cryobacterium]|uniref:shikimate dehydrogenase family protein n=1 Tax=unclassified Cryobacterium TaxID=2649013 RepID=UPI002AB4CD61|nr:MULTISPECIES: shikimate dehydrogenase [unclassified Cryobacterium]MDY7527346.1 shikimate dehydrogenase [Cryobacterium sp. 10C2]MEB0002276.1 shikimate dehydrogenase [Cryobacterium sp. RTC2.1]MEB0202392.1 shikimate dehydrogenase [Cryobacterium sp. 5I3]MEB0287380.1 shikimate dehydrogenase [Cryobacterium sp. 10S3]MEB0290458.1 shikimate dehydrogenase [Cryobacterium sp. 10C2]
MSEPVSPAGRRRLAVLGSPIGHSRSPLLHTTAYTLLGLPFDYSRAEVRSGELASWLVSLDDSWLGLSLTMPLKREVVPLLDTTSSLVDDLGVANTVLFTADNGTRRLHGFNTDVDGIVRTVSTLDSARPSSAAILGGGATAASALYAAHALGAGEITVYLRDPARATDLSALGDQLGVPVRVRRLDELDAAGPLSFVISTLPGGVADGLDLRPLDAGSILFDVAYDPWPSPIAEGWGAAGGVVFSGLDMLVEQAISQVRIFTGGKQDQPLHGEAGIRAAMRSAVGLAPAHSPAGGEAS